MIIEQFEANMREKGITLSSEQLNQFEMYYETWLSGMKK